jgi:predicted ribosomally synthesized peptide with nif11-like leader
VGLECGDKTEEAPMSEQSAVALAERIKNDPAFCDVLAAAPDRAARGTIVADAGYEIDIADVLTLKAALAVDGVSDEELDRISGGPDAGPPVAPYEPPFDSTSALYNQTG